jgi:hypothetical protein
MQGTARIHVRGRSKVSSSRKGLEIMKNKMPDLFVREDDVLEDYGCIDCSRYESWAVSEGKVALYKFDKFVVVTKKEKVSFTVKDWKPAPSKLVKEPDCEEGEF